MPSIIGHTIASVGFGKLFSQERQDLRFWLLAAYCSLIPDGDVILFYFDVPYGHMFGHRGFSHSILFAVILGFSVTLLFFRDIPKYSPQWWRYAAFFSLVTASHGLLDALTYGGYGVGFFVPFSSQRYFFPWRPIEVAPIGGLTRFFGPEGWRVIRSELIWIGIPTAAAITAASLTRRLRRNKKKSSMEIHT
ncbi:MAG: metal-dependent hydrolase [Ignavibacteriales bacterium]|nr:metal-dependent hydrolase [Ignavibacteriales bacterium]